MILCRKMFLLIGFVLVILCLRPSNSFIPTRVRYFNKASIFKFSRSFIIARKINAPQLLLAKFSFRTALHAANDATNEAYDDDDHDAFIDDEDLPLLKQIAIMLMRLIRNIIFQILKMLRIIVVSSSIAVISASFILAQKAALRSAQMVSSAIVNTISFVFKELFRFLLHGGGSSRSQHMPPEKARAMPRRRARRRRS